MYDFRSMRFLRPVFVVVFNLATISSSFAMAQSCKQLAIRDSKLPVYPLPAHAARIQGIVKLRVTVSPDGSVTDVAVIDGFPQLRAAAQDYVQSWVFIAGSKNGSCTQNTSVEFRLTGPEMDYPNSFLRFTRDDVSHTTLELHPIKPSSNKYLEGGMRN
jgi:TonB family protein